MAAMKKTFKAVASKSFGGREDSRPRDDRESQSQSKSYNAKAIERQTVILKKGKSDFIYNYNLKLHGGRDSSTSDSTLSDDNEWIEKV